jgi:hypothetical protein
LKHENYKARNHRRRHLVDQTPNSRSIIPPMSICCKRGCDDIVTSSNKKAKRCDTHIRRSPKCHHGVIARECKEFECIDNPAFISTVCVHGDVTRRRSHCAICSPQNRCPESGILKAGCPHCDGINICKHKRNKTRCKDPECFDNAGSLCPCGKRKYDCTTCKVGGGICPCGNVKHKCKVCNPIGHLTYSVQSAVWEALKSKKSKRSIEYLGCSIADYKKFIEQQFKDGMTWENHGEWHIDHDTPLAYRNPTDNKKPTDDEVIARLHYTNTKPLGAQENMSKGNRFIG